MRSYVPLSLWPENLPTVAKPRGFYQEPFGARCQPPGGQPVVTNGLPSAPVRVFLFCRSLCSLSDTSGGGNKDEPRGVSWWAAVCRPRDITATLREVSHECEPLCICRWKKESCCATLNSAMQSHLHSRPIEALEAGNFGGFVFQGQTHPTTPLPAAQFKFPHPTMGR